MTGAALKPEHILHKPFSRRKPKTVFVNSMSDPFHEAMDVKDRDRIFAVMHVARRHVFQALTRHPEPVRPDDIRTFFPRAGLNSRHVRFAGSIKSADHHERVRHLTALPRSSGRIRFLSLEPLLGPLPGPRLDGIDRVIAGGESGPRHRPAGADRVRGAGVSFFFRQRDGRTLKAGGRILDGRIRDRMPERVSPPEDDLLAAQPAAEPARSRTGHDVPAVSSPADPAPIAAVCGSGLIRLPQMRSSCR